MSAAELSLLDAVGQADLVRRRDVSPVELVEAAIQRIESLNPTLNAVITTAFDQALDAARGLGSTDQPRAFAGVPFLLKDLITECAGMRFTSGSLFTGDLVSHRDQEFVARLKRAGFVMVGKTNTPEFGMAPHCEPIRFGATRNPWNVELSTSGSSGGAAASVASGMVPAAHANDLGGSIRYPASCCGLFGLKPSRGRVPLGPEHADPYGGMLVEHVVTRTVRDSAAILDVTAGPELGDPYPAPLGVGSFAAEVGVAPPPLRIAYSAVAADGHPTDAECRAALDDAVRLCEQLGHHVEEQWLPSLEPVGLSIGTFFAGAIDWTMSYWIRRLGREPEPGEIDPLTAAFWEQARSVSVGAFELALSDLRAYSRQVAQFFERYDIWLTPALAQLPPRIGEMASSPTDPLAGLARSSQFVAFPGIVANITGNPAMSVPLWWTADGVPVGAHFLGRSGGEGTLLRLAAQLEATHPWAYRVPPVHAANGAI